MTDKAPDKIWTRTGWKEAILGLAPCGCKIIEVSAKANIMWCPVHRAAPELLEALEALGCKPDEYCFCVSQEQISAGHTGECRQARAAIAKATGEESVR